MSLRRPTAAYFFYLFFISPLCGVAQTPVCGMLFIYLFFISPLCGVAQTPDYGIVKFICTLSRSHFRHSISTFYYYSIIACSYCFSACVHHGFRLFCDRCYHHEKISEHDYPLLYYTRVHNACEYIQTYSLACPWLLSWPDSLLGDQHRGTTSEPTRWHLQPREDRSYPGQLFLWEMESHRRRCIQPLPPPTASNQVLYS